MAFAEETLLLWQNQVCIPLYSMHIFHWNDFILRKPGQEKASKISGLAEKQAPCSERKTPPEMQDSTVTSISVNSLFIPKTGSLKMRWSIPSRSQLRIFGIFIPRGGFRNQ